MNDEYLVSHLDPSCQNLDKAAVHIMLRCPCTREYAHLEHHPHIIHVLLPNLLCGLALADVWHGIQTSHLLRVQREGFHPLCWGQEVQVVDSVCKCRDSRSAAKIHAFMNAMLWR